MTQKHFDQVRIGDPIFYRETREWSRVTSTRHSLGKMHDIGLTFLVRGPAHNNCIQNVTIICDRHAVSATEAGAR